MIIIIFGENKQRNATVGIIINTVMQTHQTEVLFTKRKAITLI